MGRPRKIRPEIVSHETSGVTLDLRAKQDDTTPEGPMKAVGVRRAGQHYVGYLLTIEDGVVTEESLSEVNLRSIVTDEARIFFENEFT